MIPIFVVKQLDIDVKRTVIDDNETKGEQTGLDDRWKRMN